MSNHQNRMNVIIAVLKGKSYGKQQLESLLEEGYNLVSNETENTHTVSELCYLLGEIFLERDDFDKTSEMFNRSLTINKELYGEEHPYTAASLANLGDMWIKAQDFVGAITSYTNAADMAEKTVGIAAPFTVITNRKAGATYRVVKENGKAIAYFTKVMVALEETDAKNPILADAYLNLGELYQEIGESQYTFARDFYKKALKIFKSQLGLDHEVCEYLQSAIESCYVEKPTEFNM